MTRSNQEELLAQRIGYTFLVHLNPFKNSIIIIKSLIIKISQEFKCEWLPGGKWLSKNPIKIENFEQYFDLALDKYSEYSEGLQSRIIGTLIFDEYPTLIYFNKIQEGWTIGFYCSKEIDSKNVFEDSSYWEELDILLNKLVIEFFKDVNYKFNKILSGPYTKLFIIENLKDVRSHDFTEQQLINSDKSLNIFLEENFCIKGNIPYTLPRSVINNNFFLIRKPSFNYSKKIEEKFLLIPTNPNLNLIDRLSIIEPIGSIEFYYSIFHSSLSDSKKGIIKVNKSLPFLFKMLDSLNDSTQNLELLKKRFLKINKKYRKLINSYTKISLFNEDLYNAYNNANNYLSTILEDQHYSNVKEKRIKKDIVGVFESMLNEFTYKHAKSLSTASSSISRSYTSFTALSNQVNTAYQLYLSTAMNKYTKQIKLLTIVLIIIGLVTIFPIFKDIIIYFSDLLKSTVK